MNNLNISPLENVPLQKGQIYGFDVLEDYQVFISNCIKYMKDPNIHMLTKAFYYCIYNHRNVKRKSGAPYYTHPMKVAISLMRDFSVVDNAAVIAALLHDVVEDVDDVELEDIEREFDHQVMLIVDGLTKIKGSKTRTEDKAATYGKLFLALVEDIRVILVKLADRLDNLRTLTHLSLKQQQMIAEESLNFYTPFAQRLGLTKILKDIEDLSLYFIDKDVFRNIHSTLIRKRQIFMEYIRNFFIQINQKLNERNIDHVITFEHKHVYEIYTMIKQGTPIEEIDNFYSIVISLKTKDYSQAYRTYGIIANVFGPVSSLEDYIARPRMNLYRALHSIHFGPGRKLVEVKIRTEEMDEFLNKGISAYYSKKDELQPLSLAGKDVKSWVQWMQDLIDTGDQDAIQKIWGTIRKNLYADEITVHPKDMPSVQLPRGACPVDLAFELSDQTGRNCISAKINGELKSLDYELQNNDTIEIITSPNSSPSPDWENFVISHKAIVHLHNYFKSDTKPIVKSQINGQTQVNLRIIAEDRIGLVKEISDCIGRENICRTSFYRSDPIFEILMRLTLDNPKKLHSLFPKIWSVTGVKGIERVDE